MLDLEESRHYSVCLGGWCTVHTYLFFPILFLFITDLCRNWIQQPTKGTKVLHALVVQLPLYYLLFCIVGAANANEGFEGFATEVFFFLLLYWNSKQEECMNRDLHWFWLSFGTCRTASGLRQILCVFAYPWISIACTHRSTLKTTQTLSGENVNRVSVQKYRDKP